MTEEINYRHTARPQYESIDGTLTDEWDDPDDLHHEVERANVDDLHPLVFDIETTAESPQRPILVTVYDGWTRAVDVAYIRGYEGYMPDEDALEERIVDAFGETPVSNVRFHKNVTQAWFEKCVLRRMLGEIDYTLVGHNIDFDLGIMGSPNYEAIDALNLGVEDDWDGAITYKDITATFKRAGAFGTLYSWFDTENGGYTHIPVTDTQTAAKSMWLPSKLDKLADHYDLGGIEADDEDHGTLTDDYVAYNADDVRQTVEVFYRLQETLSEGWNTGMNLCNIYSTASIAKDVLKRMGYDRSHYTEEAAGIIAPSYFGGNTEALETGERIDGVTYMDILSQYPTVAGLTGVWETMRAETVDVESIDPEALPEADIDDLQEPETWEAVADYYVAIKADGATLPVRTKMPGTQTTRVYNADTTHDDGETTIHHYMDVLAARLHGNGSIEIEKAWQVVTDGEQTLVGATVGGTTIEADANVMVRSIEERKIQQAKNRAANIGGPEGKDMRTMGLKITGNSSYGISAERLVEEYGVPEDVAYSRFDVAGMYYNPHVASTITAGGRLMLALGEAVAEANGGTLYYCDTDSLIVDDEVADDVQAAFAGLNPYENGPAAEAEVLEVEHGHTPDGDDVLLKDVSLFALGVKKYCVLDGETPVKYTEHGLGHFGNLRSDDAVLRFWSTLMEDYYDIETDAPTFDTEGLREPLVWQQGATTETVRRMIDEYVSDTCRYGDWVERVIQQDPTGGKAAYVGLDITEKCVRVRVDADGNVTDVTTLEGEELRDEPLKRVADLMQDWSQNQTVRSNRYGRRPSVKVVDTTVVTKEATTEVLALQQMLGSVLQKATNFLFD